MGVDYRNPEGYVDPVPYQAISNMDREQKRYMPMMWNITCRRREFTADMP